MRCQTSDDLGVGSVPAGGWHGLEMVALSPTCSFPTATADHSGVPALEEVASFLPGLSPRLLIFPCFCHTSGPLLLPCSPLLLPVAEPPLGRARLSPLAAPPAGTYPQGDTPLPTGRGRGVRAVFTPLQPLLPPPTPSSPPFPFFLFPPPAHFLLPPFPPPLILFLHLLPLTHSWHQVHFFVSVPTSPTAMNTFLGYPLSPEAWLHPHLGVSRCVSAPSTSDPSSRCPHTEPGKEQGYSSGFRANTSSGAYPPPPGKAPPPLPHSFIWSTGTR